MRRAACAMACLAAFGSAQAAESQDAGRAGCVKGTNFEREGYVVRSARAKAPFAFLPSVQGRIAAANVALAELKGQPYRRASIDTKLRELDAILRPPESQQRVALDAEYVAVSGCADGALDLEIFVFSPNVSTLFGATVEGRRSESAAPEKAAGADVAPGSVRAVPRLVYDAASHTSAGMRANYQFEGTPDALLRQAGFEGMTGDDAHDAALFLEGRKEFQQGALAYARWRLDYRDSVQPALAQRLGHKALALSASVTTRALGFWQMPLRGGLLLETGRYESHASNIGPAEARYDSLKLFLGASARSDRSTWSASYGVEAGVGPGGGHVDWIKQVVDVAHEASVGLGDDKHRRLSIESRLQAGALNLRGTAPAGVSFRGGGREEPFISGDEWRIRANPVIRSLGTNQLASGLGGTRFAAISLTAAWPVKWFPLIPSEATSDPNFQAGVRDGLDTATNTLQVEYAANDPHFKRTAELLVGISSPLAELTAAVNAANATDGGVHEPAFKICTRALSTAKRRLESAIGEHSGSQGYGNVAALLPSGSDALGAVNDACAVRLNAALNNTAIAQKAAALETAQATVRREFDAIDQAKATRAAAQEMALPRRVVSTLIDEVNLLAVSPMLMFDAMQLRSPAGVSATRYGIGAGVRVTLVGSVDFSLGWMANRRRAPGEPAGALFMAMQFKDLF